MTRFFGEGTGESSSESLFNVRSLFFELKSEPKSALSEGVVAVVPPLSGGKVFLAELIVGFPNGPSGA